MSERTTRTTCPYCGVGCGLLATTKADGSVAIAGDPDHPASFGRLCSKGAALGETLSLEDRLLYPEIDGCRADWNEALELVAAKFRDAIDTHGPDAVAIYGSGQLLTEDYYIANKLMKGFIGSANLDTNSRLCMASSVAGHKRAFGSDTVPGTYEDLELADLVVLVGSNLAWCHPVLYQRLAAARDKRGTRVVVIDPRRTATCEIADLHLALRPGTDVALFNGLLQHIVAEGATNRAYVWHHTTGLLGAMKAAQPMGLREIAGITGLSRSDISAFYAHFTATERTVTVYSQGVNQSTAGTDKVNAILNCHLATGRIGRPGMGPFSVTGQPNAMGGREVGGLANMLAAHMELDNPEHRTLVAKFWNAPSVASKPGLKAVDLFHAVGDGRIKALWILATNPAVSLPDADAVRRALEACPFVVVSDAIRDTDTTLHAHVRLPSLAWGEKSGTVTNSERRISRQRAFLSAPGEARADWWQLAEVGKRMGWAAGFGYGSPAEIFAEHALLSGEGNNGTRDFDISALAPTSVDAYDAMPPEQWPRPQEPTAGTGWGAYSEPRQRFFADGRFYTPDGRARFVATPYREPASAVAVDASLILNTGRIRDQWHTMTRTAKAARLMAHYAEPFLEIHPRDAQRCGLAPAEIAHVMSTHGEALLRVLVTERVSEGTVFAPMHWTSETASLARVGALIAPHRDPVSGQPELKHTPVQIRRFEAAWFGFAVSTAKPAPEALRAARYWAAARTGNGWRLELAGETPMEDPEALLRALAGLAAAEDIVAYFDRANGAARLAAFADDRLVGLLFVATSPVAVERDALARTIGTSIAKQSRRYRLLAGRTDIGSSDPGPVVCACMSVGRNQIGAAVANGACDVATVGAMTGAGTSCGSCRAEIGGMLHAAARQKAG